MFGLSVGNTDSNYTDIDFAFHCQGTSVAAVWEGGVLKYTHGSAFTPGDVARVQRDGTSGAITYWLNGAKIYTSASTETGGMLVDSSIAGTGAKITNAVLYNWDAAVGGKMASAKSGD
jgi:hypothetical protein